MNWLTFKELVVRDFAVTAMGALFIAIKVIDKISKEKTKDIKFYKVKTENHHVRLLIDGNYDDPFILVKPRGFFKKWDCMARKNIPNCLIQDIFDESCSEEKRSHLINKMMNLRAFW